MTRDQASQMPLDSFPYNIQSRYGKLVTNVSWCPDDCGGWRLRNAWISCRHKTTQENVSDHLCTAFPDLSYILITY